MGTNQHAVIRYQALDRCFSNLGKKYFIEDLIEACNNAIYEYSGNTDGIKRRQLFEDIKFMESEAGYSIPLDKINDGKRKYYRYSDKNFSINKKPLSQTEAVLTRLEDTFKLKSNVDRVVAFEHNPYLKGIGYFTSLFEAIINKQPLKVEYKAAFGESRNYILHPYFLKQYNNRWFLFGLSDSKIMNMAIDRIIGFEITSIPYIENKDIDFMEYFSDVVGVTVPTNCDIETIILKVDRKRYNYIESKPFHESQTELKHLSDENDVVIRLKLIPNYEFETLLLGFADSIEIVEPQSLREKISERAKNIIEKNKYCADTPHNKI